MRRAMVGFGLALAMLLALPATARAQDDDGGEGNRTWVRIDGAVPAGWTFEFDDYELRFEEEVPFSGEFEWRREWYDADGVYQSEYAWANFGVGLETSHSWEDEAAWRRAMEAENPDREFGRTEIDGLTFWVSTEQFDDGTGRKRVLYANVGDNRVIIEDHAGGESSVGDRQAFEDAVADMEAIVGSLRFDLPRGSATATTTGAPAVEAAAPASSAETEGWKTVVGGAAAVAAAAAALAAAASAAARDSGKEQDPDATVGHVLQLSADHLQLASATSATLDASVWKVSAAGQTQLATDAQLTLAAPPGVGVSPATGAGHVQALLWQAGPLPAETILTVSASAGGGGATQGTVRLTAEDATALVLATVPASPEPIKPTGDHVVRVVASIRFGAAALADPSVDQEACRSSISLTVQGDGGWVDTGGVLDVAGGKALDVALSQPDPNHPRTPPEAITVVAAALVGAVQLRESIQLPVAVPPQIDARPDAVAFAAGSGAAEQVVVWVDPPGAGEWTFSGRWRDENAPRLAGFEIERRSAASATVTITEESPGGRSETPTRAATLVVTGAHDDWEPIERYVKVIVSEEGLFIDPVGRNPDGSYHVTADGRDAVTEVDVRVLVAAESGDITFDAALSESVTFEAVTDDEDSPGGAAWRHSGVVHDTAGVRSSNNPAVIHRFACPREVPTGGKALRLQLQATVPGRSEDSFTALVPMALVGVDTAPFSKAWQTELDRCRHVIDTFVPVADRARLHAMLDQRARTFGAEGLYEMRHRLWDFAETQVTAEAHDHLDQAWWYQQCEDTLDWVSWCGDIAMGVASGQLVGTAAAVGVGMLKPVLVSAMTAWVQGQSVEQWAYEQVGIFAQVVEGAATDVDLLAKLAGGSRGKAWAAFLAYSFVRELTRDPNRSVTEAMINVARMVRDQALVSFLRHFAGTSPLGAPGSKADADAPATGRSTPDAEARPGGPAADGPDATRPARPVDSRTVVRVIGNTTHRAGKPYADPRDVLDIMRDPEATRSLKGPDADPVAREAFENTRQEIYSHHDADLKTWVENNVPDLDGREVRVAEVRTPGAEPSLNTDRDYRVLVRGTDPATGAEVWTEVPAKQWRPASHEIFSRHTGGPEGDPAAQRRWAEERQQLGTDRFDPEASPDLSDQAFVPDPDGSGRMIATQTEPNIARVKRGEATLENAEALGRVYRHKVGEQLHNGHPGEAYAQAAKAVGDTRQIQKGYREQGHDVRRPTAEMREAMDIVERTGRTGFDDPAAVARAEAQLRKLHINGIGDFMSKLSGQIESLDWASRSS